MTHVVKVWANNFALLLRNTKVPCALFELDHSVEKNYKKPNLSGGGFIKLNSKCSMCLSI